MPEHPSSSRIEVIMTDGGNSPTQQLFKIISRWIPVRKYVSSIIVITVLPPALPGCVLGPLFGTVSREINLLAGCRYDTPRPTPRRELPGIDERGAARLGAVPCCLEKNMAEDRYPAGMRCTSLCFSSSAVASTR